MAIVEDDEAKSLAFSMLNKYGHRGLGPTVAWCFAKDALRMTEKGMHPEGMPLDPALPVAVQIADYNIRKYVALGKGCRQG
jgi:hypothetical protein